MILPTRTGGEDDPVYEILDLGERESSFDHTLDSHSSCRDRVGHNRAAGWNAEAYWAAIATLVVMQSTLGATLTLSVRELNESIPERISGYGPIIVDLPLQEPSLAISLLRH